MNFLFWKHLQLCKASNSYYFNSPEPGPGVLCLPSIITDVGHIITRGRHAIKKGMAHNLTFKLTFGAW